MKATTVRPALIVLLLGFLSTNGWMIVRDSGDTTRGIGTSRSLSPGTTAYPHASRPGSSSPSAPGAEQPSPAGLYAQPSAADTSPGQAPVTPRASGGPASPDV